MHRIASRDEWRAERIALLEREKALSRLEDELTSARAELPRVALPEYVFDTPDGRRTLAELFGGRSQLLVQHFMLAPGQGAGCASCSSIADGVNGPHVHLEHHDVAFVAISRAPLPEIEAYRSRMGWSFRWVSAFGSDFNFDFGVSSTEARPAAEYNFAPAGDWIGERPGVSAFELADDGTVLHSYSTYGRGVDATWGVYRWLDRAPKGRNEDGYWHRRHDEYAVA